MPEYVYAKNSPPPLRHAPSFAMNPNCAEIDAARFAVAEMAADTDGGAILSDAARFAANFASASAVSASVTNCRTVQ